MSIVRLSLAASAALLLAPLSATAASGQEIELHIEALGDAQPQQARVEFEIQASADSPEAAERGLVSAKADLTRKFGEIGIKPQQITFGEVKVEAYPPPIAVSAMPVAPPPPAVAAKPVAPPSAATAMSPPPPVIKLTPVVAPPKIKDYKRATVSIALDDLSKLEAVRTKARDFSRTSYRTPTVIYVPRDPAQAQDEAVARGIAKARAQADRYAAAMGYKVVRIARVSNAMPGLSLPDLFGFIGQLGPRAGDNELVIATTWAGVAIDFVIAPK